MIAAILFSECLQKPRIPRAGSIRQIDEPNPLKRFLMRPHGAAEGLVKVAMPAESEHDRCESHGPLIPYDFNFSRAGGRAAALTARAGVLIFDLRDAHRS
ncbi:MAG TPA: hypothetical protein VMT58_01225 [Candidatus Binataceae bacterium]|nr:hypothetical protein [Candidatus Binataceae bacterium]